MRVGIAGLGLVGGSLALDLVGQGVEVVGTDTDPEQAAQAEAAGVATTRDVESAVESADVVVVSVPPAVVGDTVARVAAAAPSTPVTDVASVKAPSALGLDDPPTTWVGGHPMAGTERTGFAAARRGMLAGATWLLTPVDGTDGDALLAVVDLVLSVQAVPVVVDPQEHDRLVAAVSHVTHLVSYGLHGVAGGLGRDVVDLVAGPSFRDATRVAASDPAFWADVTSRNHAAVADVLARLQEWLAGAVEDDTAALADRLAAARRRPVVGQPHDVEVDLSDGLVALRRLGHQGYAIATVERTAAGARLGMHRR